jgi:hypothetical protein
MDSTQHIPLPTNLTDALKWWAMHEGGMNRGRLTGAAYQLHKRGLLVVRFSSRIYYGLYLTDKAHTLLTKIEAEA